MNEHRWWNPLFPTYTIIIYSQFFRSSCIYNLLSLLKRKSLQTSTTVYLLFLICLQLTKACLRTRVQASSWSKGWRWAPSQVAGTSPLQEAKRAAHTWRTWGKPWEPKSTIYCVVKSPGAWATSESLRSTRTSEQCGPATKWLLTGK